jgi:hypothetical protein
MLTVILNYASWVFVGVGVLFHCGSAIARREDPELSVKRLIYSFLCLLIAAALVTIGRM